MNQQAQKEKFLHALTTISEGARSLLSPEGVPGIDWSTALSLSQFMWNLYCSGDTAPTTEAPEPGPITQEMMNEVLKLTAGTSDPQLYAKAVEFLRYKKAKESTTETPTFTKHSAFCRPGDPFGYTDPTPDSGPSPVPGPPTKEQMEQIRAEVGDMKGKPLDDYLKRYKVAMEKVCGPQPEAPPRPDFKKEVNVYLWPDGAPPPPEPASVPPTEGDGQLEFFKTTNS